MSGTQSKTKVLKVAIPATKQQAFDYLSNVPLCAELIGRRVRISFRNSEKFGIVSAISEADAPLEKIKPIIEWLDQSPILDAATLKFYRWISQYYQAPLSEVINCALPKKLKQGKENSLPLTAYYSLNMPLKKALEGLSKQAKKQLQLLDLLAGGSQSKGQLSALGFQSKQLATLIEKRIIKVDTRTELAAMNKRELEKPLSLNDDQAHALTCIRQHLDNFHCFLLYGVTGSGKTEVYLQTIAQVLKEDKQVLILVPEIGLTPQLLARFNRRFAENIAIIHSHLNDSERHCAWLSASTTKAKIIIGTRSAIFTPIPKLGLIVVDEEHDLSFKQMNSVRYSARDAAIIRAQFNNIPIILGTATPSLESLQNCHDNKYQCLRLNNRAISKSRNRIRIIDCRSQSLNHGLSAQVIHAIDQHLNHGSQVLVFINRRGYAPVLLCHQCGEITDCRQCANHMTVHYRTGRLQCHHCGLATNIPTQCKQCNTRELVAIGVGTQRVAEFLEQRFPSFKSLRIDKDSTSQKNAFNDKLTLINQGQAQLLIGTQMLAKGHHFPKLNCVVILEADGGLLSHDFKTIERTGQLIVQVSGRAGRASDNEQSGEVIIQSHQPDNTLLNCLIQQGYSSFSKELLKQRQQAKLPPFSFLSLIRAKAKNFNKVINFLTQVKGMISFESIQVMGPAPAPLEKKANYYRMQLLIKSSSRNQMNHCLSQLRKQLTRNKLTNGILWSIDVDPQDLS